MDENGLKKDGRTGSVRVLERLNKYEFAVEIRVMRASTVWHFSTLPSSNATTKPSNAT